MCNGRIEECSDCKKMDCNSSKTTKFGSCNLFGCDSFPLSNSFIMYFLLILNTALYQFHCCREIVTVLAPGEVINGSYYHRTMTMAARIKGALRNLPQVALRIFSEQR